MDDSSSSVALSCPSRSLDPQRAGAALPPRPAAAEGEGEGDSRAPSRRESGTEGGPRGFEDGRFSVQDFGVLGFWGFGISGFSVFRVLGCQEYTVSGF